MPVAIANDDPLISLSLSLRLIAKPVSQNLLSTDGSRTQPVARPAYFLPPPPPPPLFIHSISPPLQPSATVAFLLAGRQTVQIRSILARPIAGRRYLFIRLLH